ncbi:MAG: siderophore-interacting protein [Pseudomonadota bacterium]
MPRMNKWLADRLLGLFSGMIHPVQVSSIEQLADQLKRIRFSGEFTGVTYEAGYDIEFRISDEEFRHYTPAWFDPEAGHCDVIFYLHNLGLGSRWVEQLQVGDTLDLMGPGNKVAYLTGCTRHVIFGDASSLGFARALSSRASSDGLAAHCLLELDTAHHSWPDKVGIQADIIDADAIGAGGTGNGGASAASFSNYDYLQPDANTAYYLTGRARSIQSIKKFLKEAGASRKQVQTSPYWADGKHGL